ncbi:hypothetical protein [Mucilaginibacter endophyticus]|uniref:hypothetical protein n=1 Tax=Mucilaginibacter endophyticus TaxID=2675003 RepID=UPI000E0DEE87|nr:hypothetical protein [Mucilaginibacter endophyticus]
MAISYPLNTTETISFEELIEFVTATLDPDDVETLAACTEKLQMLSNNASFITDIIHDELSDTGLFQANNTHSAQSLMLFKHANYYMRLNIWPPSSEREDIRQWQDQLYFYLRAHDHNFDFLTVGYYGSGYGTELWEYDPDSVIGYAGESVDLTFLEKTRLPKGKAMLYRASRDIHSQFPPEDYSVSINILPTTLNIVRREQFYFDLENRKIVGTAANNGTGRYLMFNLAAKFGNAKTVNLLEDLAHKHEIPYVRLKAFDALSVLTNERTAIWNEAMLDGHQIVSGHARLFLDGTLYNGLRKRQS